MRTTMSRGLGTGRTLRDRLPTPRASGAASVLRTPTPNRARRSASREPTTALPNRDGQADEETHPNQEINLTLQLSNPRLTNRNRGTQEIMVNNLPQTNP